MFIGLGTAEKSRCRLLSSSTFDDVGDCCDDAFFFMDCPLVKFVFCSLKGREEKKLNLDRIKKEYNS